MGGEWIVNLVTMSRCPEDSSSAREEGKGWAKGAKNAKVGIGFDS
jgi:hypothetical protein